MINIALWSLLNLIWPSLIGAPPTTFSSTGFQYLGKFGYMNETQSNRVLDPVSIANALKVFQRFAGLPITGEFDNRTLNKMRQRRCGNKDTATFGSGGLRKKRFVLQGSKWDKPNLTYKISEYTNDLTESQVRAEIAVAFQWWAVYSSLTFKRVQRHERADIEIRFTTRDHGDIDPFDGAGQILAHAFFPENGGDAHFDDAETWLLRPGRDGVSLRIIAAHEIGHSLGLAHSSDQRALMAPFYNEDTRGLAQDDIAAIRDRYQSFEAPNNGDLRPTTTSALTTTLTSTRTSSSRPSTTRRTATTKRPVSSDNCNGRFDAITQLENGTTYAFQGNQFWKLNEEMVEPGFPKRINSVWRYNQRMDAALSHSQYIDLFYGRIVYRYNMAGTLMTRFPNFISSVYAGIPGNLTRLDAAFRWSGNGMIYFIHADRYWRYNNITSKVDDGYPRPLTVWKGLPDRIDSAFQWNGRTYFFRNGLYYRLDDSTVNVAQLLRYPYPRRADRWWLNCEDPTIEFNETTLAVTDVLETTTDSGPSFSMSFCLVYIFAFLVVILSLAD